MFQVPDDFLEKLKCSLCDGYLNAKPVVVKDEKQICSKCYKILPSEEKKLCAREISFEAIGNCLIFPCRYHKMGCDFTFTWNNENGHESNCKKRYFTFPDLVTTSKNISEDKSHNSNLLDISNCEKYEEICNKNLLDKQIKNGKTNLAYKTDLTDDHLGAIQLNMQGAVQFQNTRLPEILPYTEINNNSTKSSSDYENIYSTIPSISNTPKTAHCLNCNQLVEKHKKNTCLFGHVSCNNCKEDMCVVCVKNLDGSSRISCRNAPRGCKEILLQGDVGFHRDNCEFNEISCPIDKCEKKDVFGKIKVHLKEDHLNEIIQSNEVAKPLGNKDRVLVFLCYDGIFKCLYYYYGHSVEIFVVYLGPCVKALDFSSEVLVEVNKKIVKKTLGCANWNNYMLASGVNFDKKELLNTGDKKLNCVFNLKIIRQK